MAFHLCLHIVCVDVSFVIITGWKLQTGTNIHKKTCIKFCHAGTNSWKSQCIWMLNSILAQINQKDPPSPTTKLHIHRRETSFSYIPTSSLIVHFFFSVWHTCNIDNSFPSYNIFDFEFIKFCVLRCQPLT